MLHDRKVGQILNIHDNAIPKFKLPSRIVKLRSRSRSQVRSRSGPRSGPKGPRTKGQRSGPGLYTKFGLSPPTHLPTSKLFFGS